MNLQKTFRLVAFSEATSFLLLLAATAFKHSFHQPTGVTILGPIHGGLFLAYIALTLLVSHERRWKVTKSLVVMLGAVVPFGGFFVDQWLTERTPDGRMRMNTRSS